MEVLMRRMNGRAAMAVAGLITVFGAGPLAAGEPGRTMTALEAPAAREERVSCDLAGQCRLLCLVDACRGITGASPAAVGRPPARRPSLTVRPQLVRRGAGVKVAVRF